MIAWAAALAAAAAAAPSTMSTAVRTSIARIGEDINRWVGRCVTLEGPMTSTALFSDIPGLYRANRYDREGNPDPVAVRRNRIGLYDDKRALRAMASRDPPGLPHLAITGVIDSCERMYQRAVAQAGSNAVIMMSGYCHYFGGATIRATSFAVHPTRRYARLTGEHLRNTLGDLTELPDKWSTAPALRDMARKILVAGASGDAAQIAAWHDGKPDTTNEHDLAALALFAANRPWFEQALRRPDAVSILVSRSAARRVAAGLEKADRFATICIARGDPSRTAWPLSSADADNAPERPYVYTRTDVQDWRKGGWGLDTRQSRGGWLAEPVRTAFRPGGA